MRSLSWIGERNKEYKAKKAFIVFFLVEEISSLFLWLMGKIKVDEADQRGKLLEQCAQADKNFWDLAKVEGGGKDLGSPLKKHS